MTDPVVTEVKAVAATVGQTIDADVAALKVKIAALEASAKTDWSKAVAWAKANALHIALTWPAAATTVVPLALKLVSKLF